MEICNLRLNHLCEIENEEYMHCRRLCFTYAFEVQARSHVFNVLAWRYFEIKRYLVCVFCIPPSTFI